MMLKSFNFLFCKKILAETLNKVTVGSCGAACEASVSDLCLVFSGVNSTVCYCQSTPYGKEGPKPSRSGPDQNDPVQLPAAPL